MSIKFDYIQTETYSDFPSIEIKDVIGFMKYAEGNSVKFIFYMDENKNEHHEKIFFFPANNIIYKILSGGYESLEDYGDAIKNEFPSSEQFYDAKKIGCCTYSEYKHLKDLDIKNMELFSLARKGGFIKGYEEFQKKISEYKKNIPTSIIPDDINNPILLMRYAAEKGFHQYKEFEKVYDLGFPDIFIYNEAVSKGFKSSTNFYSAVQSGFNEFKEFDEAKKISIQTKAEYDNYKYFKVPGSKGLSCDEFLVLEIIKLQENGSILSLNEIRNLLNTDQEKYKISFGDDSAKVIPLWYTQKLASDDNLENFLLKNDEAKKNGFLDEEKKTFEIFRISRAKVYIDASNVARSNSVDDNSARFKNLKIVIDELNSKGFTDIVAIADASLRHLADDQHLLSQIKKDINYYEVPSHTSADEFLIEHARNEKCLIVSNDTFNDWKIKDKWIANNMDYIRIPFLITENKATMPALKAKLNGG